MGCFAGSLLPGYLGRIFAPGALHVPFCSLSFPLFSSINQPHPRAYILSTRKIRLTAIRGYVIIVLIIEAP